MMQRTILKIALFGIVLALGLPAGARAGLIYVAGTNDVLGTLDPTTGTITAIGPTNVGSTPVLLGGLAFGLDGKLYGLGGDNNFYSVNTTTGALTLIGFTGILAGGWSMGNTSDGTVYADANGVVYTINPTTGAPTTVGHLPFNTGADINGDDRGNLYIINNSDHGLYSASRATGVGTLIGGTSNTYGNIFGMAFANGTMYAMQQGGTGLYAVNLTTGNATFVTNFSTSIIGDISTAAAPLVSSVPEPSSLALFGTGLLALVGMGFTRLRTPMCEHRSK